MAHYPDIMLDLETLGTSEDSRMVILSIGAVAFDITEAENLEDIAPDRQFHCYLDIHQQVKYGRHTDPSTILWWLEQNDHARHAVVDGQRRSTGVASALLSFNEFMENFRAQHLWGNGSDFDCKAIRTLYNDIDLRCSIPWYGNRCMRTLKNMYRMVHDTRDMPNVDMKSRVAHDALNDALYQTLVTQRMYRELSHGAKA